MLLDFVKTEDFYQWIDSYNVFIGNSTHDLMKIYSNGYDGYSRFYMMIENHITTFDVNNNIVVLLALMRTYSEDIAVHCLNVSILCNLLTKWLGWPVSEIRDVTISGLLHDIGKVKISPDIINKPDKLTADEYDIVKKHTELSFDLLKQLNVKEESKLACLEHHEKLDGSGYPYGLTEENIDRYSQVVAICDIYEAMTAKRPYKQKMSPFEAVLALQQETGDTLNATYLDCFTYNIINLHLNCNVILSDGERGRIIKINRKNLTRPTIKTKDGTISMLDHPEITITDVL